MVAQMLAQMVAQMVDRVHKIRYNDYYLNHPDGRENHCGKPGLEGPLVPLTSCLVADRFHCEIHSYHAGAMTRAYVAGLEIVDDRQPVHVGERLGSVVCRLGEWVTSLYMLETVAHSVRGDYEKLENGYQNRQLPSGQGEFEVKTDEKTWEIPCEKRARCAGLEIGYALFQRADSCSLDILAHYLFEGSMCASHIPHVLEKYIFLPGW